ncbi:MAG: metallophosphoesterase, partial [Rhodoferax sp.]|nr:metallophosphoesterase [Rhodoferax sp.]
MTGAIKIDYDRLRPKLICFLCILSHLPVAAALFQAIRQRSRECAMSETLSLGLVADIHHGAQVGTKLGPAALPLLAAFNDWANNLPLDLVVELGDRINNLDQDADRQLTQDIAAAFGKLTLPRAHLLGNHDNHDLSRVAAEAAMQTGFHSWSRDLKGFHLVFWNADTCVKGKQAFVFDAADLQWLEADLASTELPTIVFSHLPLDEGSMIGNFYFEKYFAGFAHYANAAGARAVLEESGKVILCVSGHTHWNARNTIDGIHYITIHSLSESFTTWPHPSGAYALLHVQDQITLEVFGRDPAYYRLPVRQPGRHWANLSRPFAPKPE